MPDLETRARTALRHAELQDRFYTAPDRHRPGELRRASMRPLRKVLPKYLPDLPELHPALLHAETLDDVRAALLGVRGPGRQEHVAAVGAGYAGGRP